MGQAQAHKRCAEFARCKKKEKVTISTRSSSYILARNEENYWNFLHSALLQIGDLHRFASTDPSLDLRLFPRFSASSMYLLSYTRRLSIAPSKALQRPRFWYIFSVLRRLIFHIIHIPVSTPPTKYRATFSRNDQNTLTHIQSRGTCGWLLTLSDRVFVYGWMIECAVVRGSTEENVGERAAIRWRERIVADRIVKANSTTTTSPLRRHDEEKRIKSLPLI